MSFVIVALLLVIIGQLWSLVAYLRLLITELRMSGRAVNSDT